jgi:hypothetical protein
VTPGLRSSPAGFATVVRRRQTALPPEPFRAVTASLTVLTFAALVAAVFGLWLMQRRRGPTPRQRLMREVLDAADALESRLRVARAEIEAVAGEDGADPVGEAMREMLRQRLWLRDHAPTASLEQLVEVRASIDTARSRIEHQLERIERARAPVA